MDTDDIRVAVLLIEGTNNEEEVYLAFKRLGADPELVHLKQLIREKDLFDYQCLMIPGGFSAGDYIRAGAIFAARIKSALRKKMVEFADNGYPVGGICNGFQVLVELGLLPAFDSVMVDYPQAALAINDSSRFECRPTLLKHESKGNCIFTKKIPNQEVVLMPSAHAEGKFLFPLEKKDEYLQYLIDNDQVVFRYVDPKGNYADYPWNPNGSLYNIASICSPEGNVFGMMPHPERVFYRYTHPDWTRFNKEKGDGKAIFESVLDYIQRKF
jgi:phosphoribosylformylglycinamidine synthase